MRNVASPSRPLDGHVKRKTHTAGSVGGTRRTCEGTLRGPWSGEARSTLKQRLLNAVNILSVPNLDAFDGNHRAQVVYQVNLRNI